MVAGAAGGHEVVPAVGAAAVARHDVVEGQLGCALSAVLAEVLVPGEDLPAREPHAGPRPPDAVLQLDDRRCAQGDARRPHHGVVVLDDLRLLTEDEAERPAQVADVEGLVVGVQKKDDAIQRSPRVGMDGPRSWGIVTHRARDPTGGSPWAGRKAQAGSDGVSAAQCTQRPRSARGLGRPGDGGVTPGSPTVRLVINPSAEIDHRDGERMMNAYCPECETELDPGTGICPACRWDPVMSPGVRTLKNTKPAEMSLSERYRGTPYGLALEPDIFGAPAQASAGVSRGRIVVIAGLVLSVGVYGVALAVMGSF